MTRRCPRPHGPACAYPSRRGSRRPGRRGGGAVAALPAQEVEAVDVAQAQIQQHDVAPGSGEIVVTGASGGVGSFAVAILATVLELVRRRKLREEYSLLWIAGLFWWARRAYTNHIIMRGGM